MNPNLKTVSYEKAVNALSMAQTPERSHTAHEMLNEAIQFLNETQADGIEQPVLYVAKYFDQYVSEFAPTFNTAEELGVYNEILDLITEHYVPDPN